MTDYQRQKIYNAEASVRSIVERVSKMPKRSITLHNSTLHLPLEIKFGSLDGVRAYIKTIEGQSWYREVFDHPTPLTVRARKGNEKAHYESGGVIALNDNPFLSTQWSMRELVVLHEMSHHVTRGNKHGPKFAGAFLYLVRNTLGWEVEFLLADAMRQHGVDITPIPTVTV